MDSCPSLELINLYGISLVLLNVSERQNNIQGVLRSKCGELDVKVEVVEDIS